VQSRGGGPIAACDKPCPDCVAIYTRCAESARRAGAENERAGEAELLLLAVRRNAQGRGIGKMLLECFTDETKGRGAMRASLEAPEGNHALSHFERFGFYRNRWRRNYYMRRFRQTMMR
jgi:ribosomal protein S18 acetylase RimI-like enzyme